MSVIRREQTNIVGGGGSKFSATVTMVYPNYKYWEIIHMLATLDPVVFCFDEWGVEIEPWNIVVVDANTIRIYFGQAHSGLGARPAPSGKVVVM